LKINDPGKASRYFTTLDYLICGKGIEAIIKENFRSCSDHNILIWDVTFKAMPKPKKIYIPNKKIVEEITQAVIIQLSEKFAAYSGTLPFPTFSRLSEDEIKHLLSK